MPADPTVPAPYAALVDDAALFPPRSAPLEEAVAEHRVTRSAAAAHLLGSFVVDDRRLPALLALLERDAHHGSDAPPAPLPVSVVVTGGAGAVEAAVRRATAASPEGPGVELRGVDVALRDLDDLAGNARRVTAAVRAVEGLGPGTAVCVELPLTHVPDPAASADWLTALDEVAAADLRVKLRTGGLEAAAFPSSAVLAAVVDAALDREVSFRCTAGLHHAVRHRAGDTGHEHHGFLNLLLGTAAAWDGAGRDEVVALLEERDPATVAGAARAAGTALTSARRWFTSFGCCAVDEPLTDLRELGLLARLP